MLVCQFVRVSGFSLISHDLLDKTYIYIYAHHQNGLNEELSLCALFVVSTYISCVINENVRKMAKTKTLNFKFMRQMIYHLVGHENLNITVYFIFHFNVYFSRKWRKCSQNLENRNLKIQIYESNDISSCKA